MSSDHSSCLGYVMLLALLVLWPVMIFVRQRRQSLVYQTMSDEDFVLAVVGIVGGLAAVFLPILVHRSIAERIMQRLPAKRRNDAQSLGVVYDIIQHMKNRRQQFIEKHRAQFWYTPEAAMRELGDDLLVETTLNYGTLDDFRELRDILTPRRMAQVFFSATGRRAGNYYPEIRHFFSMVLKPYA